MKSWSTDYYQAKTCPEFEGDKQCLPLINSYKIGHFPLLCPFMLIFLWVSANVSFLTADATARDCLVPPILKILVTCKKVLHIGKAQIEQPCIIFSWQAYGLAKYAWMCFQLDYSDILDTENGC